MIASAARNMGLRSGWVDGQPLMYFAEELQASKARHAAEYSTRNVRYGNSSTESSEFETPAVEARRLVFFSGWLGGKHHGGAALQPNGNHPRALSCIE